MKILTSNNSEIFKQLSSKSFRVAKIDHDVAQTGAELLDKARAQRPALVIIDSELPDGSGFDVCKRIKADPELRATRVMLALSSSLSQKQLAECQSSQCDDLLCLPAPTDELYIHVAAYLGLPLREAKRVQVQLAAELDAGKGPVHGQVVDLSETGARIKLKTALPTVPQVKLRMTRETTGASKELAAQVIWQRQPGAWWEIGVKFTDLTRDDLVRIQACCLWDLRPSDDGKGCLVVLQGDVAEAVDFKPLLDELARFERVELDLGNVHRVNSIGQMRWNEFVHGIGAGDLSFVRCSLEFTTHAAMTTGMLGKGRVESLMAPYACNGCGNTELRLLQMAAVMAGGAPRPPLLRCSACAADLEFDDLPERYFSFVDT